MFGKNYTYSGIQLTPLPWTKALLDIKKRVEAVAGADFNSVLLNYYRDHRDSMGLHSDDEPELGKRPILASLSLGEERIFILKHKRAKALKPVRLKLASGSLLLMKGDTQRYWKHGIDKETRPLRATRQLDVSSHHMKLSANCAKHALFNKKLSRNSLGAPSTISGPTDKCLNCRSSNRSW
jgi:alkylated DNA repair dioxygenase AlkB